MSADTLHGGWSGHPPFGSCRGRQKIFQLAGNVDAISASKRQKCSIQGTPATARQEHPSETLRVCCKPAKIANRSMSRQPEPDSASSYAMAIFQVRSGVARIFIDATCQLPRFWGAETCMKIFHATDTAVLGSRWSVSPSAVQTSTLHRKSSRGVLVQLVHATPCRVAWRGIARLINILLRSTVKGDLSVCRHGRQFYTCSTSSLYIIPRRYIHPNATQRVRHPCRNFA